LIASLFKLSSHLFTYCSWWCFNRLIWTFLLTLDGNLWWIIWYRNYWFFFNLNLWFNLGFNLRLCMWISFNLILDCLIFNSFFNRFCLGRFFFWWFINNCLNLFLDLFINRCLIFSYGCFVLSFNLISLFNKLQLTLFDYGIIIFVSFFWSKVIFLVWFDWLNDLFRCLNRIMLFFFFIF